MRAGRTAGIRAALALAGLLAAACGPQPVPPIQPWMLGYKSGINHAGLPVETINAWQFWVDDDGTGYLGKVRSTYRYEVDFPDATYHPIVIQPRSETEFWVLGVYDDYVPPRQPVDHPIDPGEAWRVRLLGDETCGPFDWAIVDSDTGKVLDDGQTAYGTGVLWPNWICTENIDDPELCPLNMGEGWKCTRLVWCPDPGQAPPRACWDQWVANDTLEPWSRVPHDSPW